MNKIIYFSSALILLSVVNCSKNDNPIGPDVKRNVLFYDSFEKNGMGTLDNWSYINSAYSNYFSFSTDVPNNNGNYSLCIENDSVSGPYIYRTFKPDWRDQLRYKKT
ncbi:MAG: hypothetical protein P8X42_05480 [Calditrichaceae bacterium]